MTLDVSSPVLIDQFVTPADNPETGLVTLAAPLRGYSVLGGSNSIRGWVVATDGGAPARRSSAAVTLTGDTHHAPGRTAFSLGWSPAAGRKSGDYQ